MFGRHGAASRDLLKVLEAVTGFSFPHENLPDFGRRVVTTERLFSCREGISRADDRLPDRLTKEPLLMPDGRREVVDLSPMLDEFYERMGWDAKGIPKPETLAKLGISV